MNRVAEVWKGIKPLYKIAMVVGLAIFILVMVVLNAKPDTYQVLYSNLDKNDAQDITKELVKMGVDYTANEDGTTLSVDGAKTASVRIQLANLGLPSTGNPGFELLDSTSLGETQYDKKQKYARALKGQLEKDLVQGIDGIEKANVQLSLAQDTSIFREDETKSKATVGVTLKRNVQLEETQIKGIQNFVAGAIQNLESKDVVVVDAKGVMLSDYADGTQYGSYSKQAKIVGETEDRIKSDIMKSLSKIFGYNHVDVNVRAAIDFDEIVKNIEKYDPQGTLVSKQTTKENSAKNDGSKNAEPGVESNGDVPDYQTSTGTGSSNVSQNKEDIIENFEVGKTVETIKQNPELTQLSVVVWVDKQMTDEEVDIMKKAVATSAGITDKNNDKKYDNGDVEIVPVVFNQNSVPDTSVSSDAPLAFLDKLLADKKLLSLAIGLIGVIIIAIILLVLFGRKRKEVVVLSEAEGTPLQSALATEPMVPTQGADTKLMSGISQQKANFNEKLAKDEAAKEKQKVLIEQVKKASEDVEKSKDFIKQKLREE